MAIVCKQLQDKKRRLTLLHGKKPFRPNWPNDTLDFKSPEVKEHNDNLGYVMNEYQPVFDFDDITIYEKEKDKFPETYTTATGGGGVHVYGDSEEPVEKIVMQDEEGNHIGEVQAKGQQVVIEGSIHPKTGKKYEVLIDAPIATFPKEVYDYFKTKYTKAVVQKPVNWNSYQQSNIGSQIKIESLFDMSKLKLLSNGEYQGASQIHDSTTGTNLNVNTLHGLWKCWRHNSGGDALSYLAVKEGICDCSDFSSGKLTGEDFIKTLNIAKEKYGVKVEDTTFINTDLQNKKIDSSNFVFDGGDGVDNLKIKNAQWLIDGILPETGLTFLLGKSADYKSFNALHYIYCIDSGKPVYGRYATKKKKVFYINKENHLSIFKPMIQNTKRGLGVKGDMNILFNKPTEDIENPLSPEIKFSLDVTDAEGLANLENVIREKGIEVLVVDSLKRFIYFEENDADKVSKWYNAVIRPLLIKYNLAIIVIAHSKKEQFGKFRQDKRDMMRGSSDFINIADNILCLQRCVGEDSRTLWLDQIKCRIAEEFPTKVIKVLSDREAGMITFEELTTDVDTKADIEKRKCANDILNHIFKYKLKEVETATLSDIYGPEAENGYKKNTFYEGMAILKNNGVLMPDRKKGKYHVYTEHHSLILLKEKFEEKNPQTTLMEEENEKE